MKTYGNVNDVYMVVSMSSLVQMNCNICYGYAMYPQYVLWILITIGDYDIHITLIK